MRDELLKLLSAPDPAPVVRIMEAHAILGQVLPEPLRADRLAALVRLESDAGAAADPELRLAALLAHNVDIAGELADRLRFSRKARRHLVELAEQAGGATPDMAPQDLRAALYRLGARLVRDLLLLRAADDEAAGGSADRAALRRALAEAEAWTPKTLPVSGADVQALGVGTGPQVGQVLREVERWWVAQDFAPDRSACLAKLREVAARG